MKNVIKGLRNIDAFIIGRIGYEQAKNFSRTIDEVIVLLKEQEAIEPDEFMDGLVKRYKCKKCGKHLIKTNWQTDNFCSNCGKEIIWNDSV